MRQILLLPLAALLAMPVFSQTPADTTLTIRNRDSGYPFRRVEREGRDENLAGR